MRSSSDRRTSPGLVALCCALAGACGGAPPVAPVVAPSPPSPIAAPAPAVETPPAARFPSADDGWTAVLPISFATGGSALTEDGEREVADLAAWLGAHPELLRIQVAVHSDSRGASSYNLDMSRRRAGAIRERLVEAGIDGARISAAGYGEECPVDRGVTAEAQARNRRVEVFVLQTTDGCTGAAPGCPAAIADGLVPPSDRRYLPGGEACP